MITFTPLSGGAQSSQTTPLCYLLQVDDVRILLDCGSLDRNPESYVAKADADAGEEAWDQYTRSLERHANHNSHTDHLSIPTLFLQYSVHN